MRSNNALSTRQTYRSQATQRLNQLSHNAAPRKPIGPRTIGEAANLNAARNNSPNVRGASRGIGQAGRNISNFGGTSGNVASSSGTAITGSARTNAAIEAWNKARNAGSGQLPTTKGTKPLPKGAALTGLGAGSTASAGSLGLAPVSSVGLGTTVGLGAAGLGTGLLLGNTIYEGLGRPFGPSLGDYVRQQSNQDIAVPSDSTDLLLIFTPGTFPDPTTYGESGKRYVVTYQTRTDRGADHSDGPAEGSWQAEESITATGPIGTAVYIEESQSVAPYFKGITGGDAERDSIYSDQELLDRSFLTGVGTSNINVFIPKLRINSVVEVGGDTPESPISPPVTSPLTQPRSLPTPGINIPTTPSQPHTPFEPFIAPESVPVLPLGVPTTPEGQPDIKEKPTLPEVSPQVTPGTTPETQEGQTTRIRETTRRSTGQSNRSPNEDIQLPGTQPLIDPAVETPVVPSPAPKIAPAVSPLTEADPELQKLLNRLEEANRLQGSLLPLLIAPALLPKGTAPLEQNNPGAPPSLPRVDPSKNCGCNGAINRHTDDVGQQLSNKLDNLNPFANLPDLAGLGLIGTILDAVNAISGAVGVADFPITVPDTINGKQSTTKKLNNLTEMHEWNARNLDSVMGHWPNVMNSDDGKVLEFDSLNDQMNELMGINMAIALAVGINQQLGTKSLVEMQGLKQESHLAHRFARMNSEYLGYRVSEKVNNSPSAISMNANDITGFLNPSTVPFVTARNEENQDLQTCLTELCEAAHIIMARFKRRVNAVDPERDLRDLIKQAQTVRDDSLTVGQRKAVSDFDEFIQQVEQGFGIADSYGRDNNQNPSIIDFSS